MFNQIKSVGFVGIGKLGLPCAEVMSQCYDVVGYDIYPKKSDKIKISKTLEEACKEKDIIFVAVQTPHDKKYDGSQPTAHLENKDFDYTTVKTVLRQINQYVTKKSLVVLISTVLPGTIRGEFAGCINNARFIYNPYLIAMGSVAWDMVNPEMVIVGTDDGNESGDAQELVEFYRPLLQNNPRIVIGTWDEAECIKIFYNTFISAKISLVNMIQDVAVRQGNINVDLVTCALAESSMRITGTKYMTAGMGDAGPCHPRDNIALRWLAKKLNLGYDLFSAIMLSREGQAQNLANYLIEIQKQTNLPIVIHGKSYKPDIDILDGSYSLLVGSYLEQALAEFFYVDPLTDNHWWDPKPAIILLAHNRQVTYGYTGSVDEQSLYFIPVGGSIIVDPWRRFSTDIKNLKVVHYGNTRKTSH